MARPQSVPMAAKDELGRRGEDIAAAWLTDHGLTVLARNWRCAEGELDIVATDQVKVVVCEVKTRSGDLYGSPFEAVTQGKRRKLRRLGLLWMAANPVKIKRIAFGLSIATASLAGACLIIIQPVEPSIGREYIGRIFAICVLGGLGSFPGMIIAAMTLGIVESLTSTFFGPSWAPAVAFGVLLVTLAVRPSGILGR